MVSLSFLFQTSQSTVHTRTNIFERAGLVSSGAMKDEGKRVDIPPPLPLAFQDKEHRTAITDN